MRGASDMILPAVIVTRSGAVDAWALAYNLKPVTTRDAFYRRGNPLQNRLATIFSAHRAYVMYRFTKFAILLKAVNVRTGWRLPELVAGKLILDALRPRCLFLERHKFCLELDVCKLSVFHLIHELKDNMLHLAIVDWLFALKRLLQRTINVDRRFQGVGTLIGKVKQLAEIFYTEFHNRLQLVPSPS